MRCRRGSSCMRTRGPATAHPTRCPRFAPLRPARGVGAASSPGHREYAAFGRLSHPSRGRDTCPSSRRFRCGGPADSPQRDDRALAVVLCRAGRRRSPGSAGRGAGGRGRPPAPPPTPIIEGPRHVDRHHLRASARLRDADERPTLQYRLVLRPRLARRSATRGRTPASLLSRLRRAGAAHRPHAVALARPPCRRR